MSHPDLDALLQPYLDATARSEARMRSIAAVCGIIAIVLLISGAGILALPLLLVAGFTGFAAYTSQQISSSLERRIQGAAVVPAEVTLTAAEEVQGDPDIFAAVSSPAPELREPPEKDVIWEPNWDYEGSLGVPLCGEAFICVETGKWIAVRTGSGAVIRMPTKEQRRRDT